MDTRLSVGYTIFNQKYLIQGIVDGFKDLLDEKDEFVIVFDGCTDGSYEVFDRLKHLLKCKVTVKVFEEDQFEIKANNWILKNALYDTIVLFQDDILNRDPKLREKIFAVYEAFGDKTGLIGGRSGFELDGYSDFPEKPINKVSNWEHKPSQFEYKLKEGEFKERTFLNRGPIIFSRDLIKEAGYLNETYYPLWGDDLDYCCKSRFFCHRKNVVFQCDVVSNLNWGTTHKKGKSKIKMNTFKLNWYRFIESWGDVIKRHNYENPFIV